MELGVTAGGDVAAGGGLGLDVLADDQGHGAAHAAELLSEQE